MSGLHYETYLTLTTALSSKNYHGLMLVRNHKKTHYKALV